MEFASHWSLCRGLLYSPWCWAAFWGLLAVSFQRREQAMWVCGCNTQHITPPILLVPLFGHHGPYPSPSRMLWPARGRGQKHITSLVQLPLQLVCPLCFQATKKANRLSPNSKPLGSTLKGVLEKKKQSNLTIKFNLIVKFVCLFSSTPFNYSLPRSFASPKEGETGSEPLPCEGRVH